MKPVNLEPSDRHHQRETEMRAIISFKKRELANELPELENITINLAKLKLQTTEVSASKNDTLIRDDKAKTDIAVVINGALWSIINLVSLFNNLIEKLMLINSNDKLLTIMSLALDFLLLQVETNGECSS